MTRWKELPAALDERERQLVVQLRRLKDHSGLSLAALASRTAYSRSSWERYLNGKQPVPRQAVEELAAVTGTAPTRLLVLHEVAARTKESGQAAPVDDGADVPPEAAGSTQGAPVRTSGARGAATLTVLALALVLAFGAGLATARLWQNEPAAPVTYSCEKGEKDAMPYAGHSVTREALLDIDSRGPAVAEAQCLLERNGFDPGTKDGVYGERTKAAVRKFQKKRGLVQDGIVGPDTWGELRR
ncbi:peptidoglycan-binding protein [Streptomyces sp. NPDC054841]